MGWTGLVSTEMGSSVVPESTHALHKSYSTSCVSRPGVDGERGELACGVVSLGHRLVSVLGWFSERCLTAEVASGRR